MKKAAWMIIRDDSWYIDMAIESLVKNVDGIYILDTGSTDGTLDVIKNCLAKYPNYSIVVETKTFGGDRRFGPGFMEKEARNYALEKALSLFSPDWIVQLDGDEVFNSRFWELLETTAKKYPTFAHSTSMPILPCYMNTNPADYRVMAGLNLFDPHIRSWNANLPIRWIQLPGRHASLAYFKSNEKWVDIPQLYATKDHVHFHLHRAFGPKSLHGWFTNWAGWDSAAEKLGIPIERINDQTIYEQKFPENFKNGKFIPPKEALEQKMSMSEPLSHPMLLYTVTKWKNWWNCEEYCSE